MPEPADALLGGAVGEGVEEDVAVGFQAEAGGGTLEAVRLALDSPLTA